jgi:hypothetical protein
MTTDSRSLPNHWTSETPKQNKASLQRACNEALADSQIGSILLGGWTPQIGGSCSG